MEQLPQNTSKPQEKPDGRNSLETTPPSSEKGSPRLLLAAAVAAFLQGCATTPSPDKTLRELRERAGTVPEGVAAMIERMGPYCMGLTFPERLTSSSAEVSRDQNIVVVDVHWVHPPPGDGSAWENFQIVREGKTLASPLGIAEAWLGIAPHELGKAVIENNRHIKRLLEQEAQHSLAQERWHQKWELFSKTFDVDTKRADISPNDVRERKQFVAEMLAPILVVQEGTSFETLLSWKKLRRHVWVVRDIVREILIGNGDTQLLTQLVKEWQTVNEQTRALEYLGDTRTAELYQQGLTFLLAREILYPLLTSAPYQQLRKTAPRAVIQELERWAVFDLPQYEEVIEFAEYTTDPSLLPYLLYPTLEVLPGELREIWEELYQQTKTEDALPESAKKKASPPNYFLPFQKVINAKGVGGYLAAHDAIVEKRESYVAHRIAQHVKSEEERLHSFREIQAWSEELSEQAAGEPSERGGGVTVEPSFAQVSSLMRTREAVFIVYGAAHNFDGKLKAALAGKSAEPSHGVPQGKFIDVWYTDCYPKLQAQ
ncbi:MAG: hypothetical protein KatS3mg100_081 [Candidatus Parcubacteria bacterium]|nr:MAG: hypothetical protein KatS3mg100_081 [Candidatus Parcubacteria bacterium]